MTTASYTLVGFDPLGLVPAARPGTGPFTGTAHPVPTTLDALRARLTTLAAAGRTGCVIAVLDADRTPEAVSLRRELNQTVLSTGSPLVPCVVTDDRTVRIGPWIRPRSTPCLACFAPDLLPAADGFRLDALQQPAPSGPNETATKPDDLIPAALEEVLGTLRTGLRDSPDRSVWGRVLSVRVLDDGQLLRESWRAPRDPDCPSCGAPSGLPRLSRILHENSKLHEHFRERDAIDSAYATAPDRQPPPVHRLPDVRELRSLPLEEAITRRRSRRRFGPSALDPTDISALLHYSSGVTGWARTTDGGRIPLRAAPSGGALYPIDVYVYLRRATGLPQGLFRYDPLAHALLATGRPADAGERLSAHSAHREVLDDAAAIVLLAASFGRTQAKYLERGYRIALMEAGHIAQNLQLVATARRLRVCGVTGFVDDTVNDVLGLPPQGETQALYLLALGRPPHQPSSN